MNRCGRITFGAPAVSYTHLDVYKRQAAAGVAAVDQDDAGPDLVNEVRDVARWLLDRRVRAAVARA